MRVEDSFISVYKRLRMNMNIQWSQTASKVIQMHNVVNQCALLNVSQTKEALGKLLEIIHNFFKMKTLFLVQLYVFARQNTSVCKDFFLYSSHGFPSLLSSQIIPTSHKPNSTPLFSLLRNQIGKNKKNLKKKNSTRNITLNGYWGN